MEGSRNARLGRCGEGAWRFPPEDWGAHPISENRANFMIFAMESTHSRSNEWRRGGGSGEMFSCQISNLTSVTDLPALRCRTGIRTSAFIFP